MDTGNFIPQRLGGALLMDQRSAREVVMLIWLRPLSEDDYLVRRILPRHVIVGALHITREPGNGVLVDTDNTPLLRDPVGRGISYLGGDALTKDMRKVLARLKQHLKTPQSDAAMATLGGFADLLGFYVFERGLGPGWMLDYAARTYPMNVEDAEG